SLLHPRATGTARARRAAPASPFRRRARPRGGARARAGGVPRMGRHPPRRSPAAGPACARPLRGGAAGRYRGAREARRVMLSVGDVAQQGERIVDEIERAVVGKRETIELVLLGFLADGHVLLEDFPGLAKTLIARSFAQVCDMQFARIQFTPDLMPSDVTGSSIYNQRTADFEFRPGPVFANLVLGAEINRAR